MIKKIIPEIYLNYIPNSILELNIIEKKATCHNCALRHGHSPFKKSYHENLKCCTFHPFQTNFLIGNIFSSSKPKEVIEKIKNKIHLREYVLPIGIISPPKFHLEFEKEKDKHFGNREDWLCPYYDKIKNNCGIWDSRNSTCISFHCISDYNKKGFEFWDKMSNYISFLEMTFMEEVLEKLNFTPFEISEQVQFLHPEKKLKNKYKPYLNETEHKYYWKNFDDPIEFYKKCFEIASNFSNYKFKKILGEQGKSIQDELLILGEKISS